MSSDNNKYHTYGMRRRGELNPLGPTYLGTCSKGGIAPKCPSWKKQPAEEGDDTVRSQVIIFSNDNIGHERINCNGN